MNHDDNLLKQIALLLSLLLVAYSTACGNSFVWDDLTLVTQNPVVHRLNAIPALFTAPFFNQEDMRTCAPYWRPLVLFSFSLDYAAWGNNPFGYHLTNLVLHALNALLVLLLWRSISCTRRCAAAAALLFALHPLQTNAVAYISGRTDLLAATFLLLAFLLHLRNLGAERASTAAVAGIALCLACALLAKESALAAPVILYILGKLAGKGSRRRQWGAILLSCGIAVAYVIARTLLHLSLGTWAAGLRTISVGSLCAACRSLIIYARLFLLPVGLHMERFIDIASPPRASDILCASLVLLSLLAAIRAARRGIPAAYLPLLALAALLPASNLIPLYPELARRQLFLGEQFLYLPMAGLAAFAATMVMQAPARLTVCPGAAALAMLGMLTYAHNDYWRDDLTFYTRTLAHYPGSARINTNLALLYATQGNYADSLNLLRRVVEGNPLSARTHCSLAAVHLAMGHRAPARERLGRALAVDPDSAIAHDLLGLCELSEGHVEPAIEHFRRSAAIAPGYLRARLNLAAAYEQNGRPGDAARTLRDALLIDPSSIEIMTRLAAVYEKMGDPSRASDQRRAILRLYPECAPALGADRRHMP